MAHIINHLPCYGRDLPSTSSGTFRFYRVFFYYFEKFLRECKNRFEKKYGYFRPVIQDVVEKYPDCGNPMCGFARMRCPDCWEERLLMFSCKTRGFCPSYHAKLREEWEEWMREELLLNVPHRQVVFAVPKMLFLFFCFKRKLLTSLCLSAVRALVKFLHTAKGLELMPVHQLPSSYPCLDDQRNHSLG